MIFKNEEFGYANGQAVFILPYNGFRFIGKASCHPDDMDMESERTGLCIAEARAYIKVLKFRRNHEIMPALKPMRDLLRSIESSKKYNEKSYEMYRLRTEVQRLETELDTINNAIAEEEKSLKDYINQKDALYKRLRARNQ